MRGKFPRPTRPVNLTDSAGTEPDYSIHGPLGIFGPGIGYLAAPAGSHTDDILIHTATAGAGEVAAPLLKAGGRYLLEGALESTVFKATTSELRRAAGAIGEYANAIIRKGEGAVLEGTNVSFRVDGGLTQS